MKTKIAILSLMLVTACHALPIQFAFTPSPMDAPGDGLYFLCALPANATDPTRLTILTNVPAGTTNFVIDSAVLPYPQVFITCLYSNSLGMSVPSVPVYFDSVAWFKQQPPPPGPVKPIKK